MAIQALNPQSLAERMVAELNENPEARRLLLRALLTDEFLMLPAKVDRLMDLPDRVKRLESDVSDLKVGQTRMEGDIADLKAGQAELQAGQSELQAGQAELRAGQAELRAGQSRMQGQIGNMNGRDYERRIARYIVNTAYRDFDMLDIIVLSGEYTPHSVEFVNKLHDAETRGLIAAEQANDLLRADFVVSGTRKSDRSPVHAVAEVSVTIGESDVVRAVRRAAILATAMGEPTIAAVIGDSISEPDRRRAEQAEVVVALIRQ